MLPTDEPDEPDVADAPAEGPRPADPVPPRASSRRRNLARGLPLLIVGVVCVLVTSCLPQETTMTDLVNAERTSRGVPQLQPNLFLYFKALNHSSAMAGGGPLRHSVLAEGNPYPWTKLGENVGVGGDDIVGLNGAFMRSNDHRANIVDPAFQYVGVGVAFRGDGSMWVTQEFMRI